MFVPLRVRASAVRVFGVAFTLFLAATPLALAQDGNAGAPPPPQQPPPIVIERPAGLFGDPKVLARGIDYVTERLGDDFGEPTSGFYPELSNMVTGSGWISAGPGYRQYFSDGNVMLDGSAAVSWHLYTMAQGRIEFPKLANGRLLVGAQGMWRDQTQLSYFGLGPDVTDDDRSQYRLQVHDVVGYASLSTTDWLSFTGEFGWLGKPKVMAPSGPFPGDFPDVRDAFPFDPAVSLSDQPNLYHSEAAVVVDTRDYHGHPTRGFRYRAALTNYTDQSTGVFSYRQYEAEGTHFIPITDTHWVLAFRGWSVFSDVPVGHDIPFYLLPAIGGHNTLRAYSNGQFKERNLLVANAEARLGLTAHIDGAVFFDAGNVAARYSDLNLDKTSFGVGMRLHTEKTTFARLDVAHGSEGWRFVFRTSDPLRLARGRRRVAEIPFLP